MLLINRWEHFHINTNHSLNVLHKLGKDIQTIILYSISLTAIESLFSLAKPQPIYRNLAADKNIIIKSHYYGISDSIGKKY